MIYAGVIALWWMFPYVYKSLIHITALEVNAAVHFIEEQSEA